MQPKLSKLAHTVRKLVEAGYPRERALLVVYATWALTPEEITILSRLTGEGVAA